MPRVLLIHGAALTARSWDGFAAELSGLDVVAPTRPMSGSLDRELAFLAPLADGAFVVGVSGGATLALALAAGDAQLAGGIAHEPAAGSLEPSLLAPMAAALAEGGVDAFASTLYGPAWDRPAGLDDEAVRRDVTMFRGFEPAPARAGQGSVLVTTGGDSPEIRHRVAAALAAERGYETRVIPGVRHFVQKENPAALAALVRGSLAGFPGTGLA